jgi:hypothetical protein
MSIKEMVNLKEFSYFGRNFKAGFFDKIDPESYEYTDIWNEELYKCINGCTIGDISISGRLYSYVNFGSIEKLNPGTKMKEFGLPDLRDIDLMLDRYIDKAIEEGKNLMAVAGRRLGKSYYGTWVNAYYSSVFNAKTMVATGREDKLNVSMNMVNNHILGLQDTELFIPILKGTPPNDLILGYSRKDDNINKFIDIPTGGAVYARNFRNDFTIANGLSTKYVFIEEIGMFDNLIKAYESMKYCWREGNTSFGFALLMGTGGDMEKGSVDAYRMFIEPDTYDLLTFKDPDKDNVMISLFIEGYYSFNEFRGDNGILDKEAAIKSEMETREKLKKSNDIVSLYNRMQYSPLKWQEAFLKSNTNFFPNALIQKQIEFIETNPQIRNKKTIGTLDLVANREVKFVPDTEGLLKELDFPLKDRTNNDAGIVIYEFPEKDRENSIPFGLYIAGLDPYAQDEALNSVSLGSCFIYKRMYDVVSGSYNLPVAEYTARPKTINEFYENVRKLLIFYNAECLYENNIRGFKEYLETKNSLYLLSKEPELVKDIIKDSYVSRNYGIHMTREIKNYIVQIINNYLLQEFNDEGEVKLNIEKIYSLSLLKEMREFNFDENFDRIISFGLCLLKDLSMKNFAVKKDGKEKSQDFFRKHFDKTGWTNKKTKSIFI